MIYRGAKNNDIIVGFSESSANTQMMGVGSNGHILSLIHFLFFIVTGGGGVIDVAKTNQD